MMNLQHFLSFNHLKEPTQLVQFQKKNKFFGKRKSLELPFNKRTLTDFVLRSVSKGTNPVNDILVENKQVSTKVSVTKDLNGDLLISPFPSWTKLAEQGTIETGFDRPDVLMQTGSETTKVNPKMPRNNKTHLQLLNGIKFPDLIDSLVDKNKLLQYDDFCNGFNMYFEHLFNINDKKSIPKYISNQLERIKSDALIQIFVDMSISDGYLSTLSLQPSEVNLEEGSIDYILPSGNPNLPQNGRSTLPGNYIKSKYFVGQATNVSHFSTIASNLTLQVSNNALIYYFVKNLSIHLRRAKDMTTSIVEVKPKKLYEKTSTKLTIIDYNTVNLSELLNTFSTQGNNENIVVFTDLSHIKTFTKLIYMLTWNAIPWYFRDQNNTSTNMDAIYDFDNINNLKNIIVVTPDPQMFQNLYNQIDINDYLNDSACENLKNLVLSLFPSRLSAHMADCFIMHELINRDVFIDAESDIEFKFPKFQPNTFIGALELVHPQNYGLEYETLPLMSLILNQFFKFKCANNAVSLGVINTLWSFLESSDYENIYSETLENYFYKKRLEITTGALTSDKLYSMLYLKNETPVFLKLTPGYITSKIKRYYSQMFQKDIVDGRLQLKYPIDFFSLVFSNSYSQNDLSEIFGDGFDIMIEDQGLYEYKTQISTNFLITNILNSVNIRNGILESQDIEYIIPLKAYNNTYSNDTPYKDYLVSTLNYTSINLELELVTCTSLIDKNVISSSTVERSFLMKDEMSYQTVVQLKKSNKTINEISTRSLFNLSYKFRDLPAKIVEQIRRACIGIVNEGSRKGFVVSFDAVDKGKTLSITLLSGRITDLEAYLQTIEITGVDIRVYDYVDEKSGLPIFPIAGSTEYSPQGEEIDSTLYDIDSGPQSEEFLDPPNGQAELLFLYQEKERKQRMLNTERDITLVYDNIFRILSKEPFNKKKIGNVKFRKLIHLWLSRYYHEKNYDARQIIKKIPPEVNCKKQVTYWLIENREQHISNYKKQNILEFVNNNEDFNLMSTRDYIKWLMDNELCCNAVRVLGKDVREVFTTNYVSKEIIFWITTEMGNHVSLLNNEALINFNNYLKTEAKIDKSVDEDIFLFYKIGSIMNNTGVSLKTAFRILYNSQV